MLHADEARLAPSGVQAGKGQAGMPPCAQEPGRVLRILPRRTRTATFYLTNVSVNVIT